MIVYDFIQMNNEPLLLTEKLKITTETLERATQLFYKGDAHYSALLLASAAEEIFGKHVEKHGSTPAFDSRHNSALNFSSCSNRLMTKPRNLYEKKLRKKESSRLRTR